MDSVKHCLLYEAKIQLDVPQPIGGGPDGTRAIFPVESGSFEGPRLKGRFLPGGGDWARIRPDGSIEVDARTTAQTDDGAYIYIHYHGRIVAPPELLPQLLDLETAGVIDPSRYYFRVTPYFETGHEKYRWLNGICALGLGRVGDGGVSYQVYEIL